ncbi:MAG: hypothetical protein ACT4N2_15700 [Hyphomicrobium sp.]
MSIKRSITSAIVTASLLAGSALPLATSAQADSWGDRQGYSRNHGRDWDTGGDRRTRGWEQYARQRDDDDRYDYAERAHAERAAAAERASREERRERKHDKKVARGIAIGIGVLMLGAILSQAGDHNRR